MFHVKHLSPRVMRLGIFLHYILRFLELLESSSGKSESSRVVKIRNETSSMNVRPTSLWLFTRTLCRKKSSAFLSIEIEGLEPRVLSVCSLIAPYPGVRIAKYNMVDNSIVAVTAHRG
jgi:hypothetical protein